MAQLSTRYPSVEVLCARDLEEALEKLAETGGSTRCCCSPAASSPVPPTTPLPGRDPGELLAEIVGKLSS